MHGVYARFLSLHLMDAELKYFFMHMYWWFIRPSFTYIVAPSNTALSDWEVQLSIITSKLYICMLKCSDGK